MLLGKEVIYFVDRVQYFILMYTGGPCEGNRVF